MSRRIRNHQLIELTMAHAREVSRQPAVLFWGIIFPILISLGLGLAFTRMSETVHSIAVVRGVGTEEPPVIDRFLDDQADRIAPAETEAAEYRLTLPSKTLGDTTFLFDITDWQTAIRRLKRAQVSLILTESDGEAAYRFDPMNPEAQLTYLKLSRLIGGQGTPGREAGSAVEPLTLPGTRYIDFLVPGLIAMVVMMSCMWGIGYGMIDKRSKKLLRRLVATPMKRSYFLIAQMVVRIGMNVVEAGLLFLVARLVFGISVQGNVAALLLVFLAGNIAFGGLAILTASRTSNTEVGNGLINAIVMPMMVLSGVFFSYTNFPDWSLPVIKVLPLTLLADGMRGVFIEGAGILEAAPPSLALVAMGTVFFLAGLRVFRWH